jgi:cell division protein ZapA
MGNSKVTVKINSSEYTLMGDEAEDYLFSIANYVDKKIKETLQSNPRHSTTSAAVLTAITLADDLFRLKKQLQETKKAISEPENQLASLKEEHDRLKGELIQLQSQLEAAATESKEKEQDIGSMRNEYDSLYDEYAKKDEELQKLVKENSDLKVQGKNTQDKLEENSRTIAELKNQLLESQIELVSTKKQLKDINEQQNRKRNL